MPTTRTQTRLSVLAAFIGTALIAAPQAAIAAPIDACKLVDLPAARKVLGTTLSTKPVNVSASGTDTSMCNYTDGTMHGGFMLLAAPLKVDNLADEVASQEKSIAEDSAPPGVKMPKPTISNVSGLGDAAFLVTIGDSLQIHAFAKNAVIVVSRNVKATPKEIAKSEKVARLAMTNLP